MFDIGFTELVLVAVVGLLVIGPERLPGAIRTASLWLNRLKRGFNDIKREVQQELHNDEVMQQLRETGKQIKAQADQLGQGLDSAGAKPGKPTDGETPTGQAPVKPTPPADKSAE
ncbi:MAG: Sec-independent protein translocase protein TatB [Halieaceae bacterium]|jgi:sec-independent protein translocase protein TatB|nr:Sec-independent protein translocase protein TatB [Halieaceae bacterium]